jgi:hypothetical protein
MVENSSKPSRLKSASEPTLIHTTIRACVLVQLSQKRTEDCKAVCGWGCSNAGCSSYLLQLACSLHSATVSTLHHQSITTLTWPSLSTLFCEILSISLSRLWLKVFEVIRIPVVMRRNRQRIILFLYSSAVSGYKCILSSMVHIATAHWLIVSSHHGGGRKWFPRDSYCRLNKPAPVHAPSACA